MEWLHVVMTYGKPRACFGTVSRRSPADRPSERTWNRFYYFYDSEVVKLWSRMLEIEVKSVSPFGTYL